MMSSNLEKTIDYTFYLLAFLSFVYLAFLGPLFFPDSGSYISASAVRPPLYPLFLKAFKLVFADFSFMAVVIFQLVLNYLAIAVFVNTIRKVFAIPRFIKYIFAVVLALPLFYTHSKFANVILTEGLCYPLFLLAVACLIKGVIKQKLKYIIYFLVLGSLLILTRKQFLFLYPVFFVVMTYAIIVAKSWFKWRTMVIALVVMITVTSALERGYQYINDGNFQTVPVMGMQLIVAPLFVSKLADVSVFKDVKQNQVFTKIMQRLHSKGLLSDQADVHPIWVPTYHRFAGAYNPIMHNMATVIGEAYSNLNAYEQDQLLVNMAVRLIMKNKLAILQLYSKNIINSMGGYYYFILLVLVSMFAFILHVKTNQKIHLICLLILLLQFANYSLVAIVEPVLHRYSAYTDPMAVIALCLYLYSRASKAKLSQAS